MPVLFPSRAAFAALAVSLLCASPSLAQFTQTNLVSDDTSLIPAKFQDPNLINAWGISASPTGPFWVSAADAGVSTLYNTAGVPQSLVVSIPNGAGLSGPGSPTGQVFNGNNADFLLAPNRRSIFIFATEQGTISGWNPGVNATNAINKVDNSAGGASYKGLALANNGSGNFLYAADIVNRRVDIFDNAYGATTLNGNFADPNAPSDYAPFNIQNLGGKIYVTFAKTLNGSDEEIVGDGYGFVSVFDANGNYLQRLASGTDAGGTLTDLNAPWGLAIAPAGFGKYSGNILVGNFGSGKILAFDAWGNPNGALTDFEGNDIVIDGLWGLYPGNGGNGGSKNKLYFAAGPYDETHGLFGSLAVPEPGLLPFAGIGGGALAFLMIRRRRKA